MTHESLSTGLGLPDGNESEEEDFNRAENLILPPLWAQSAFNGRKTPLSGHKILRADLAVEILDRLVDMNSQLRRIIREELLRSIVWIGLGIVGWSIVISEVMWVDATALAVFGLPVLTWALVTTSVIGIRTVTSAELQVQTPMGLSISLILGIVLGGVAAVYLVTIEGYATVWMTAAYVAVTVGTIFWYWFIGLPDSASEMAA